MSRVMLAIEQPENRRLLAEWLSLHHEVATPESAALLVGPFDLAILDGPSLDRCGPWIEHMKRVEAPTFLPVLLVTARRGASVVTGHRWERVDELIVSPIEKLELHARVETLLRARTLSVANASLRLRLEKELARAREVQAGLLPRDAPRLPGFELAARCIPAHEVGGDFFDWQPSDGTVVLSVGDVMGKGIPAALLAATVRAVLRALALQNAPGAALDLLRQSLSGDLERTSSFVTLFHAQLAVGSQELRYVDAGHGHALVRRVDGTIEHVERGGRPVGFPATARYQEGMLRFAPGDALFVYSDGLCEGSEMPETLIAAVDGDASAPNMLERVLERAPRAETSDDVTVLVLKRLAA